jgi:predicted secreted hydrolase
MTASRVTLSLAAFALLGTIAVAAAPPADVGGMLGREPAAGFAQVTAPRTFSFPADEGPHPEFRQEWWYTTGNLEAANGERFGFELTFFRYALEPPTAVSAGISAWHAREIYLAHFAVTDAAAGRFRYAQKFSRAALGLAGATAEPLHVWVDDWYLKVAPGIASSWLVHAGGEGYELDLELDASGARVLNGVDGFSAKSATPGDASYYYSLPRVGVRGRLVREGRPIAVTGLAWFDREWGSGALGRGEVGWDWFALQLQDGSALMFYALRDTHGGIDPHSAGTWVDPAGVARPLSASQVSVEVTDRWLSPRHVRYPSAWRVRVPQLGLDLTVRPLLADQELLTTPRYWEGAVDVRGTRAGDALGGRGYVELVGYPQER